MLNSYFSMVISFNIVVYIPAYHCISASYISKLTLSSTFYYHHHTPSSSSSRSSKLTQKKIYFFSQFLPKLNLYTPKKMRETPKETKPTQFSFEAASGIKCKLIATAPLTDRTDRQPRQQQHEQKRQQQKCCQIKKEIKKYRAQPMKIGLTD